MRPPESTRPSLPLSAERCGLVVSTTWRGSSSRSEPTRIEPKSDGRARLPLPIGSPGIPARRLFACRTRLWHRGGNPFRQRGIDDLHGIEACDPAARYYVPRRRPNRLLAAMIRAVNASRGHITGAPRNWLEPSGATSVRRYPTRAWATLSGKRFVSRGQGRDVLGRGHSQTMRSPLCQTSIAMVAASRGGLRYGPSCSRSREQSLIALTTIGQAMSR